MAIGIIMGSQCPLRSLTTPDIPSIRFVCPQMCPRAHNTPKSLWLRAPRGPLFCPQAWTGEAPFYLTRACLVAGEPEVGQDSPASSHVGNAEAAAACGLDA